MDLNINHIRKNSCEVLDNFENKNAVKKIGVLAPLQEDIIPKIAISIW